MKQVTQESKLGHPTLMAALAPPKPCPELTELIPHRGRPDCPTETELYLGAPDIDTQTAPSAAQIIRA